jgi:four helix bundle protein
MHNKTLMGFVRKELNESLVWLRLLERSGIVDLESLAPSSRECDELCRIIAASRKTAEKHQAERRVGKAISDI